MSSFFLFIYFFLYGKINPMNEQLKRPEKKYADTKVSDEDMIYFSLGIDKGEFLLPSQRDNYLLDKRAVALVEAVKLGKDLSGQDFSGINLKGADISGGHFSGSKFLNAVFYETKAVGCDFSHADFSDSYIEKTDFSQSSLVGIKYKRLFARDNDFTGAIVDNDAVQFFSTLEKIILLIEQGKIDIRILSKDDLLCLDIRRLDFTNIDLDGLDLSVFALDGINLSGSYIDPKQLMSLDGLKKYYLDVQKLKDKRRREEALDFMNTKKEALERFSKEQMVDRINKKICTPVSKIQKPVYKLHQSVQEKSVENFESRGVSSDKDIFLNRKILSSTLKTKENLKRRIKNNMLDKIFQEKNDIELKNNKIENRIVSTNELQIMPDWETGNNISKASKGNKKNKEEKAITEKQKKEKNGPDDNIKEKRQGKNLHLSAFKVTTKSPKTQKMRFKTKG